MRFEPRSAWSRGVWVTRELPERSRKLSNLNLKPLQFLTALQDESRQEELAFVGEELLHLLQDFG